MPNISLLSCSMFFCFTALALQKCFIFNHMNMPQCITCIIRQKQLLQTFFSHSFEVLQRGRLTCVWQHHIFFYSHSIVLIRDEVHIEYNIRELRMLILWDWSQNCSVTVQIWLNENKTYMLTKYNITFLIVSALTHDLDKIVYRSCRSGSVVESLLTKHKVLGSVPLLLYPRANQRLGNGFSRQKLADARCIYVRVCVCVCGCVRACLSIFPPHYQLTTDNGVYASPARQNKALK